MAGLRFKLGIWWPYFAALFGLALGLLIMQPATAQTLDVLQHVKSGRFDALEKYFSSLENKFDQGQISEEELVDAYRPFYLQHDVLSGDLNLWVEQRSSYTAHLARGIYFRKLGELNRGTRFASETPPEKLDFMIRMFQVAKRDFWRALQLKPVSYLATLHLLNIAQFEGDRKSARMYVNLANRIHPTNFMARARYLIHLQPRWGGTHEQMQWFIDECRLAGVPADRLRWLEAIKREDEGSMQEDRGELSLAQQSFKAALALSIDAAPRFRRAYINRAIRICSRPQHSSQDYCR